MNTIKRRFSIKDMETLCGVKAHTIRIWEKRYRLLKPARTQGNIRYYSTENLQKLLNVVLLYRNGYKISKIATISEETIPHLVKSITIQNTPASHYINTFKMAMLHFDGALCEQIYQEVIAKLSFREIFTTIFIPLLNDLGLLWQINAITPSHEHFITHFVRQKIIFHTEKLRTVVHLRHEKTYVLYLPEDEIHEIGLLCLQYELTARGCHTVYLGQSVPLKNLKDVLEWHSRPVFVSYVTVNPAEGEIELYLESFATVVNTDYPHELWLFGKRADGLKTVPPFVKTFASLEKALKAMDALCM